MGHSTLPSNDGDTRRGPEVCPDPSAAAAALLVPSLRLVGSSLLVWVTIGAVVTHLRFDPLVHAVPALICLVLLSVVLCSRGTDDERL